MSTGTKRPWADAAKDAKDFLALFPAECYEDWRVAGSLRRRRPEVGDVEHVIRPAFADIAGPNLFAEPVRTNLLWQRLDELVADGTVRKHGYGATGNRWGDKYRGVDFRGFLHELFTADADNFGAILTIRTGPADFSTRMVTRMKDGGMYRQQEGRVVCVATQEPVPVATEEAFFALCGAGFLPPAKRA